MKVIYIAGPFRGKDSWEMEKNIRRAEALALEVWRHGAAAICPHANTRFFQGAAPDEVWLKGDLEILNRCDAVLMTKDWSESLGAVAERRHAEVKKIPIFYTLCGLISWLSPVLKLCPGCGNKIDPEQCQCGSSMKNHESPMDCGHSPVPVGCTCGYTK